MPIVQVILPEYSFIVEMSHILVRIKIINDFDLHRGMVFSENGEQVFPPLVATKLDSHPHVRLACTQSSPTADFSLDFFRWMESG